MWEETRVTIVSFVATAGDHHHLCVIIAFFLSICLHTGVCELLFPLLLMMIFLAVMLCLFLSSRLSGGTSSSTKLVIHQPVAIKHLDLARFSIQ